MTYSVPDNVQKQLASYEKELAKQADLGAKEYSLLIDMTDGEVMDSDVSKGRMGNKHRFETQKSMNNLRICNLHNHVGASAPSGSDWEFFINSEWMYRMVVIDPLRKYVLIKTTPQKRKVSKDKMKKYYRTLQAQGIKEGANKVKGGTSIYASKKLAEQFGVEFKVLKRPDKIERGALPEKPKQIEETVCRVPSGSSAGGQFASCGDSSEAKGMTWQQKDDIRRAKKNIFGRDISDDDVLSVLGVKGGSISYDDTTPDFLVFNVVAKGIEQYGGVFRRVKGGIGIVVGGQYSSSQRSPEVARANLRLALNADKNGIKSVIAQASASGDDTGAYSWVRLGGYLKFNDDVQANLRKQGIYARDSHELIGSYGKKGLSAWKKLAVTADVEFDLTKGSETRKILAKVVRKLRRRLKESAGDLELDYEPTLQEWEDALIEVLQEKTQIQESRNPIVTLAKNFQQRKMRRDSFFRRLTQLLVKRHQAQAVKAYHSTVIPHDLQQMIDDRVAFDLERATQHFKPDMEEEDFRDLDRFMSRIRLYDNSTRYTYENSRLYWAQYKIKFKYGRRIKTSGESCATCLPEQGVWKPIEDVIPLGNDDCGPSCKCKFQFANQLTETELREAFPGHRGRPGLVGGSLPRNAASTGAIVQIKGMEPLLSRNKETLNNTQKIVRVLGEGSEKVHDSGYDLSVKIADSENVKSLAMKSIAGRLKGNKDWEDFATDFVNSYEDEKAKSHKTRIVTIKGKTVEMKSVEFKGGVDNPFNEFGQFAEFGDNNSERLVAALIGSWADDSRNTFAVAMHQSVSRLFGTGEHVSHNPTSLASEFASLEKNRKGIDAFVRATYAETQDRLKKGGVRGEVMLSRGMDSTGITLKGNQDKPLPVNLRQNPLSSYSTSVSTAAMFAQDRPLMLYAKVPVERIFAIPRTGPGCLEENEVIVIGAPSDKPDKIWGVQTDKRTKESNKYLSSSKWDTILEEIEKEAKALGLKG